MGACSLSLKHTLTFSTEAIPFHSKKGEAGGVSWGTAQKPETHLYPVILHIFHTRHADEGGSPPVHCLQLHVDQKAVGWPLWTGNTVDEMATHWQPCPSWSVFAITTHNPSLLVGQALHIHCEALNSLKIHLPAMVPSGFKGLNS